MRATRSHWGHAARVAAAAAAVVVACYLVGLVGLDLILTNRIDNAADNRIASELAVAVPPSGTGTRSPPTTPTGSDAGGDLDDAPVFLWRVNAAGIASTSTPGAPRLFHRNWSTTPVTLDVHRTALRFDARRTGRGWLVAGQSVAEIGRIEAFLLLPEIVFGIALALATLVGSFIVGLRASAPLDLIRRRQAEFTADASHEIRTPLTVVEAEVELALQRPREPAEYEEVLRRIRGEGRRLRRIVEDLLWLARADSVPTEAGPVTSDLAETVTACARRLRPVAEQRGVTIHWYDVPAGDCPVHAPPEWIDRLAGVLIDNAIKFAGNRGRVEVHVLSTGTKVGMVVEDSGPGIPPEERSAVLDRFHRATTEHGGTGLGLAIADSVVRLTHGTWAIDSSHLGGARMAVWWRRSTGREGGSNRRPPR